MVTAGDAKTDPPTGVAGDIYTDWTGDADAGLLASAAGSAVRGMLGAQINAVANAIAGNVSPGFGDAYSASYDFGGGAHDFTADGAWTDADFTAGGEGYPSTGELGDGTNEPRFYVYGPALVVNLDRTAGGALRLEYDGLIRTDAWPAADNPPVIVVPLPRLRSVTCEFLLTTNAPSIGTGANNFISCGLLRPRFDGGSPLDNADVRLQGVNGTRMDEVIRGPNGVIAGPTDRSAFVSAGTYSRRYKLVRQPNGVKIYGETTPGSGTWTLIVGKASLKRYSGPHDEIFILWEGTGYGFGAATMWAEISELSFDGVYG